MAKYEDMLKAELIQLCYEKDEQISALQAQVQELSNAKQEAEQARLMVSLLFDEATIVQRLNEQIQARQKAIEEINRRIAELQSAPLRENERNKLIADYNAQVAQLQEDIKSISELLAQYGGETA